MNSHCGANFKKKTREHSLSSDIKKLVEHLLLDRSTSFFFYSSFENLYMENFFQKKTGCFRFLLFSSVSFSFLLFSSVFFRFLLSSSVSFEAYQRSTRSVSGMNILLSGLMSKASYHALMCGKAPSTRHWPSAWGSLFVRLRISFSVMLPAHTPE